MLERERPGAGASGVAAGMLAPVGEATYGEDALLELALRSHALWPAFARELADASGSDPGFLGLGALHVALDRDETEALRRRFELMESLGLEAEWLRGARVPRARAGPQSSGSGRRPRPARGRRRPPPPRRRAPRRGGARRCRGARRRRGRRRRPRGRLGTRGPYGRSRASCGDRRPRRRRLVGAVCCRQATSRRCGLSRVRSSPSGPRARRGRASGSSSASASTSFRAATAGSSSARPSRSSASIAASPREASTSCCARRGGRCPTSTRWSCSRWLRAFAPGRPTTRR